MQEHTTKKPSLVREGGPLAVDEVLSKNIHSRRAVACCRRKDKNAQSEAELRNEMRYAHEMNFCEILEMNPSWDS